MLIQRLSKIGEIIVERNLDYQWAFKRIAISLLIYIDKKGDLVRWELLDKPITKKIPIGVFEDSLSTSRTTVREELPYLIYDNLELFTVPIVKEIYINELINFLEEVNEPDIDCIGKFIVKFDWESFIRKNRINEKYYFYIFIENDEIKDPFENELIANKVNKYIYGRLVETEEKTKDSVGIPGERTRKASRVLAAGNSRMRLVTNKAYRENYYDEFPVARMSLLTDFYCQIAIDYLKEKGALHIGSRWFALFSIRTGLLFPLFLTPENLGKSVDMEVDSFEMWQIAKEEIVNKFRGEMIYVEFDVVSGARISTISSYEYNSMDVEILKQYILKFVDKTVIWKKSPKSLGDKILTVLKSNHNTKDISYSVEQDYSIYLQEIIRGDYQKIVRNFISPYIIHLILNEKKDILTVRDFAEWSYNLSLSEKDGDLSDDIEYDMGRLIGYADIFEKLYLGNKGTIRNMIPEYINAPRECWKRIWPRLIKSGFMDYPINKIVSTYRHLESREWGKGLKLDHWKIVEAFCLTKDSFWEKKKNVNLFLETLNKCLSSDVIYIPLKEKQDEPISIRYKISIEEYIEEDEYV